MGPSLSLNLKQNLGRNQKSNAQPTEKTEKILPLNYEAILKEADSPVDMSSMDKSLSQPMEKTEKILPHNYEAILKEADSPVDISSMDKSLSQLRAGVFLNQKRKKYWVDKNNKNCFMLFARDLSITWGEDNRYWHWSYGNEKTSNVLIDTAELLQVCWLEVLGKFDVAKLSPGTLYEVVFIVMLTDEAYGWEVPVNFRLTLPNKQKVERKEKLTTKPRGKWIVIPVGEFTTSSENVGELEICFHEYDGGQWKSGLLVQGVAIQPKT